MAEDGIGLQEIDAGANACSVEWCPIAGFESYVACSTYLLESTAAGDDSVVEGGTGTQEATTGAGKGQTRSGSIVVHKVCQCLRSISIFHSGAWLTGLVVGSPCMLPCVPCAPSILSMYSSTFTERAVTIERHFNTSTYKMTSSP